VRRLEWHLLEHLMKTHVDFGITFNQLLEFLNNWVEIPFHSLLGGEKSFCEPSFENLLIFRQPSTDSVVDIGRRWRFVLV
jgi:hypothetical protein